MTDRSLFPDGVPVHDVDLQNESTQVSAHIRRRLTDTADYGAVSGGVLTVNGTLNYRFDMTALVAYAPNGELIELGAQTSVSLADYTTSAINSIYAVYSETNGTPQAHQSDGTTPNTRATRSARLVVLTAAQVAALASTSSDYSVNAVDRMVLLGQAIAFGFTGATPNAITLVQTSTAHNSYLSMAFSGTSVTGVTPSTIDQATSTGNGTLAYVNSGQTLSWTSPGGTAGATVAVGAGGQFTLTSGTTSRTITVRVIAELLPRADISETLVVSRLYSTSGAMPPLQSVKDLTHRDALGTDVIPTSGNAHGLAPRDWGTPTADIPWLSRLGEGYLATDLMAALPRLTARMRSGVRTAFAQWQTDRTNGVWARMYMMPVGTGGEIWITSNARYNQASAQWVPDYSSTGSFALVIGPAHIQMRYASTAGAAFAESAWITTSEWNAATYVQQLGSGQLTGSSDSVTPRLSVPYRPSGQEKTTVLESLNATTSTYGAFRLFRASTSDTGGAVGPAQFVFNASYNNSTTQWHQTDSAYQSIMMELSSDGLRGYVKAGGSADWSAGGWTNIFHFNASGQVYAGTDFRYFTPPTNVKSLPGMAVIKVSGAGAGTGTVGARMTESTSPGGSGGGYGVVACSGTENGAGIWDLQLPDGATITSATISFDASSMTTGTGHAWAIYRQSRSSNSLSPLRSAGILALSTSAGSHTDTFTPDQFATIDNTNYSYFVYVVLSSSGGVGPTASVYSIQVSYTMTTLRGA